MERTGEAAPGPPRIRPSQVGDATALRALRLEALERHPEAFLAEYELEAEKPAAHWQELASRGDGGPDGALYLATDTDALLGMAGISRGATPKVRHSGVIWGVYVRPEWRGQGIGEALVRSCLRWARGAGLRLVRIAAVISNEAAIRCYERCGFTPYGIQPKVVILNGVAYDDLLLSIRL